jgi:hypothetical protein
MAAQLEDTQHPRQAQDPHYAYVVRLGEREREKERERERERERKNERKKEK